MLNKKSIAIALITALLSITCLTGFNSASPEKIPGFGVMKESDTRQSYWVIRDDKKVKKIQMSEMEALMITRLFNTNDYTDTYSDNRFTPKLANPYIEIRVNPSRNLILYCAGNGFVFLDRNKQYYIEQSRYGDFFTYCSKKYAKTSENSNQTNEKYKPIYFKLRNFLDCFKKGKISFDILKTVKSEDFSCPVTTISFFNEEIDAFEFKDNIDMELGAMKLLSIMESADYAKKPHFFKKGNIIVTYFGDNIEIVKSIKQIMGKQYAGFIN